MLLCNVANPARTFWLAAASLTPIASAHPTYPTKNRRKPEAYYEYPYPNRYP